MSTEDDRAASDMTTPRGDAPPGQDPLSGHKGDGDQLPLAAEGSDPPQATVQPAPNHRTPAGTSAAPPANNATAPSDGSPEGRETSHGHPGSDAQLTAAVAADIPSAQRPADAQGISAAGEQNPPATARRAAAPMQASPWLAEHDRALAIAADILLDLERVRIANENRLRQFTRPLGELDADGRGRGFGWTTDDPAVERLATMVARMLCESKVVMKLAGEEKPPPKFDGCCQEHDAERNLVLTLKDHPLGAWVKAQKGIGPKQGARLIAAVGDPYLRPDMKQADDTWESARPRTVSELWAYCGYHTIKGAAARRARGERANWSADAKMRAYLIAEKCVQSGIDKRTCGKAADDSEWADHAPDCTCSPYRTYYDEQRVALAGAVHSEPCVRCGPKGKPAEAGSPLSLSHKKGRALRKTAKRILRDLWREGRRLHQIA